MSEKIGEVFVDFQVKTEDFDRAIDKSKKQVSQFNSVLKNLSIAAAGYAILNFYKDVVKAASDAEETNQKFGVTFREVSVEAEKAAQNLAENYGLAQDESKKLLADTGTLLQGFGYTGQASLDFSQKINELAVDMASFSNIEGGATRASQALTSAIVTGETEALKTLGKVVTDTMAKEELARMGMANATGDTLKQAMAQARFNLILKQSQNDIGDFSRSMDSTANVQRRVEARFRDMAVEVGSKLTPALAELGVTFLETSKDGGVIMSILNYVTEAVSKVILSISALINLMNKWQAEGLKNIYGKAIKENEANLKSFNSEIDKMGYKNVEILKQEGAKTSEGRALLKEYEKINKQSDNLKNLNEKNNEQLTNSSDRINKITKMLNGELSITKDIINQREKQKNIKLKVDTDPKALEELAKARKKFDDEWIKKSRELGLSEVEILQQQKQDKLNELKLYHKGAEQQTVQYKQLESTIIQTYDKQIADQRQKQLTESSMAILGQLGNFSGQLNQLFQMATANENANLDNRKRRQDVAIQEWYDSEKTRIDNTITNEQAKNDALEALDQERARRTKAVDDKIEKEKRKLARESAKTQKKLAVFDVLITTPQAAIQAFKSLAGIPIVGYGLGLAAAAATTAMGLAKLKLIKDQPLPELAAGGVVMPSLGGTTAVIGEAGAPEMIMPLTNDVFKSLGNNIMNAISRQPEATIESNKEPIMVHNTVNIAGKTFYDVITKGIEDKNIRVNRGAIIDL